MSKSRAFFPSQWCLKFVQWVKGISDSLECLCQWPRSKKRLVKCERKVCFNTNGRFMFPTWASVCLFNRYPSDVYQTNDYDDGMMYPPANEGPYSGRYTPMKEGRGTPLRRSNTVVLGSRPSSRINLGTQVRLLTGIVYYIRSDKASHRYLCNTFGQTISLPIFFL